MAKSHSEIGGRNMLSDVDRYSLCVVSYFLKSHLQIMKPQAILMLKQHIFTRRHNLKDIS